MGFSRDLWSRLGHGAWEGRRAWSDSRGVGGLERALWIAGTVLLAIPIFALLLMALLGAVALTIAALSVATLWAGLVRLGIVRSRRDVTVIRVSRSRSDP